MKFCFEYDIWEDKPIPSITMNGTLKVDSFDDMSALAIAVETIKKMVPPGMTWHIRSTKCTYTSDVK